MDNMSKT